MVSLASLTSPLAVKAAMAEADRRGRSAFLKEYGFRNAREYEVEFEGVTYDSKAIAAVAYGYQHQRDALTFEECNGGETHGSAGWALDRLGFKVTGMRHVGWWLYEVEPAVDVYLSMQQLARAGQTFRKSDFLKQLHAGNPTRTIKAFEYKLQNVSAALRDVDRPWLEGYAPAKNYQALVRFVLEDRLGSHAFDMRLEHQPPATHRRSVKIDWAERDASNRELGHAGEQFVVDQQRDILVKAGRSDLAKLVKWVAEESDGDGYDIESFTPGGARLFIEVKTTCGDALTPFFLTARELAVWVEKGKSYQLHRLFKFPNATEVRVHEGVPAELLQLVPHTYRVTAKKT
jgi:hypothetical protein